MIPTTCKECHKTEFLQNHTATVHKERERLGDRRNVGENSCNCGDETGQKAQHYMFMMMMIPTANYEYFSTKFTVCNHSTTRCFRWSSDIRFKRSMLRNREPGSLITVCERHNACSVHQYCGSFTNSPDLYHNGANTSQFKDELDLELDGFLSLYNKCRDIVFKQDMPNKCTSNINTNRCTCV
jgi:hypothetical protein